MTANPEARSLPFVETTSEIPEHLTLSQLAQCIHEAAGRPEALAALSEEAIAGYKRAMQEGPPSRNKANDYWTLYYWVLRPQLEGVQKTGPLDNEPENNL